MRKTNTARLAASALALSFQLACDRDDVTPPTETPRAAARSALLASQPQSTATFREQLAQQIPEFGGAFTGKDHSINVYLTDLSKLASASPIVDAEIRRYIREPRAVHYLQGRYTYTYLASVEVNLRPFLGNASFWGVDDRRNRFLLQIPSRADSIEMTKHITGLRIPADVIILEIEAPFRMMGTHQLTDRVRPLLAGLLIAVDGPALGLRKRRRLNRKNDTKPLKARYPTGDGAPRNSRAAATTLCCTSSSVPGISAPAALA